MSILDAVTVVCGVVVVLVGVNEWRSTRRKSRPVVEVDLTPKRGDKR